MKKIGISDLFEQEDIFKAIRDSADKTLQKLDVIQKGLQDFAKGIQKSFSTLKLDNLKDINQLIKLVEKSNELNKQAIALDKTRQMAISQKTKAEVELQMIEQQKLKTQQEQIKTQKLQQQEQSRLNKEAEKAAKAAANQNSAYKQLEKNTRELKNQSKELGAQMLKLEQSGKKNTTEYQKLSEKYKLVTQAAQQGDAQLKKLDKTVGDNFRNVGNYQSAVGKLQNVLGQLGIAFGISTVVRSAFTAIKDFDQGMANLASVLGTTRDQIIELEDDAKRLGATTKFTAGEVAQLQTEFAKLGFTQNEILNSTGATLALAGATGTELGRAAEVAGATLRGFALDASEMQRVTDVMAKSFSSSALDMESFAESMKYVAPVASAAGVSLEETTAMIGALADSGIKGSQAGTSLRRILTDMAATGKPATEALADLSKKGITMSDAMDEVGRSAQTALLVLSKNQNKVDNLTNSLENAEGAAQSMADTQLKTVGGSLALLQSAWEGYILKINDASGAGESFSKAIKFLADNLDFILTTVLKVVKVYAAYKAMQLSLIAIEKARNFSLSEFGKNLAAQIPMTKAYKQAQQQAALATTQAGTAAKTAGSAMNAIPWMAIIGVVIELATAFYDVASGAKAAREQQKLLDAANETAEKNLSKAAERYRKDFDKKMKDLDLEIRTRKSNGESEKKLDAEKLKREKQIAESTIKNIKSEYKLKTDAMAETIKMENFVRGKIASIGKKMTSEQLQENKKYHAYIRKVYGDQIKDATDYEYVLSVLVARENRLTQEAVGLNEESKKYKDILDENTVSIKENSAKHEDNTGKINAKIPKLKEYKTQLSEVNEYLSKQNELLAKIDEIEAQNAIDAKQKEIDAKLQNDIKYAKESGDVQVDALEQLIIEKYKLEKQLVEQQQAEKLRQLEQQYAEQSQKERDELLKNRDELLSQEGLSAEKKKEINDNYYKELEQIQYNDLQRNADLELEKRILGEETKDELTKIEEDKASEINEVNDQLFQAQSEYYDKVKEESDKTNNELLEKQKQNAQNMQEYFKLATDYFIKQSNERIAQLDKEIEAAEKQSETLKTLAAEGNINAQQSLAEQERIIAESNLRKQQEQRKQQRLQLANSVFSTYASKVEAGSKNALAETIRDTTLLQAFINSIPAFYDGTEDTGSGGGLDGKGGFHAILHPHERVIPQSLNEKIGSLSNEQLTRIAQEYQNGKMVKSDVAHSSMELAILVNEMKDLKEIIRNKPETNIELGQITQSSMEIVERTRKGNTTVYNRFKVRS